LPRPMAFLSSIAMRALASMRTCFLLPSTSALFRASVSLPLSFQRTLISIKIIISIKMPFGIKGKERRDLIRFGTKTGRH